MCGRTHMEHSKTPLKLHERPRQKSRNLKICTRVGIKARVAEKFGVAVDFETIIRVHEVAKFLDIKFLQELTETLIMRAPSREFMEMVSPRVNYDTLEAYRSHHVEACRNLEVAVQ